MTTPRHETTPDPTGMNHDPTTAPGRDGEAKHGGHGLMMMLMCLPMLLIAGFLVVSGVAGTGGLVAAVLCMTMMAAMMFMMPGGHSHR